MTSARPFLHLASPEPDDAVRRLLVSDSPAMMQLRWMVRLAALESSRWTVAAAARRVGRSRTIFADRMRRYGLDQLQSQIRQDECSTQGTRLAAKDLNMEPTEDTMMWSEVRVHAPDRLRTRSPHGCRTRTAA